MEWELAERSVAYAMIAYVPSTSRWWRRDQAEGYTRRLRLQPLLLALSLRRERERYIRSGDDRVLAPLYLSSRERK
jgi:hypothetical protein